MKFVIQRVLESKVEIDGKTVGQIERGFMILVGISHDDNKQIADKMVDKTCKMRIFEDGDGKTNLSLADVEGKVLVISQFTLYADCKKGNRPSFINAAKPDHAQELYQHIVGKFKEAIGDVQTGIFGEDMKVSLVNDGPFTVVLDSAEIM